MVIACGACATASVHLDIVAPGSEEFGSASGSALAGIMLAVPGALLLWRLGPHPMAVVLALFGVLWALDGPAVGVVNLAITTGIDTPLASWGFWYYVRAASVLSLSIQLILVLFPDGHLPRGPSRIVGIAALTLAAIMPLTFLFAPARALAADEPARAASLARFDPGVLSIPLPDAVWSGLLAVAFPCTVLSAILAIIVTAGRRRNAQSERRAQLRWLIWAGIVFIAMLAISRMLPPLVADIAFSIGVGLVSVSIVIAVTRHGLYAIDGLLSWTIVYAVVLVGIVLVDVGLYLLVGTLFDDRVTTLIAVLVVVAVYTPMRDRLHRLISRWINGTRGDPYEVVSRLAGQLESAGSPEQQLRELADALARAFASSYVRVEVDRSDGTIQSADSGTPGCDILVLPLAYDGTEIGRILMHPGRRPGISARDRQLLGDIVRLATTALRNADLNRELQLIREGLVSAREEERARLRRELHDGLGPLLSGITLRLETVRNITPHDPARAREVLDTAIVDSRTVVDEIRRLVHDLRPPALDDLGLARAIEQQGRRLGVSGLAMSVEAPPALTPVPAVEVAAYRIASEALANIVKHAGARHAWVRLIPHEGALIVEVEDDGSGIAPDRVAGVGLASLRERAVELGGTLEIVDLGSGTLVRASLPSHPTTTGNGTPS